MDKWLSVGCIALWPISTYQASSSGWQAHNGTDQLESVSLLAQLNWSEAHIEQSADTIAEQLLAALKSLFPASVALPNLIEMGAHRWRYAQPVNVCKDTDLYSASGLALCGDSFRESRVEDAWLSGHRLREALIGRSV